MLITSIRIKVFYDTKSRMVGLASLTLDNMLAIHDIKILNSSEGLFLAMASRKKPDGSFEDIFHPVNADVRSAFERMIIGAYNYCYSQKLYSVQYDIVNDKVTSLIEQSLEDFRISDERENSVVIGNYKTDDEHKNDGSFLNWLKS